MAKEAFNKNSNLFTSKLDFNLRKKLVKCHFEASLCVVLDLGYFGKKIGNTSKVLKCGAGEGWRRSVGSIV